MLVSVILSLFSGCQSPVTDATQGTAPSTEPSQSTEATVPSDKVTEPSSEVTEPTSEATEPTETTYPRTIESFKSYLTPYMTYGEAKALWGSKDGDGSNIHDIKRPIWYLENDYYVVVVFYPTMNERWYEYSSTIPTSETNPDGTSDIYTNCFLEWHDHMEAYRAVLYKGSPIGKREQIEVLFDYGYGPWQQEE